MGLRTVDGVRKPGWFTFAGGNRLSLDAPAATRRSARFRVSGVLASRAFGALAGKHIMLQSRRPGQARWAAQRTPRYTRREGNKESEEIHDPHERPVDLGQRKPGWYAFAGGNSLTLKAPASARRGVAFAVSGKLTSRTPETPQSEVLTLQARKPSSSKWSKAASVHTALDGSYSRTVKQSTTKIYRMVWGGVVESATRKVRTL